MRDMGKDLKLKGRDRCDKCKKDCNDSAAVLVKGVVKFYCYNCYKEYKKYERH